MFLGWYGDNNWSNSWLSSPSWGYDMSGRPRSEILTTDDSYIIKLDASPLDEDSLEVSLDGQYITVKATVQRSSDSVTTTHKFSSFRNWSFFVGSVSADEVEAELNNGFLIISVPKQNKRTIPIQKIS